MYNTIVSSLAHRLVAPCFLPNALAGDYWIVEAGPSPDNYEYALVVGGQPSIEYDDGCTTVEDKVNGAGLWIFSRSPTARPEQLAAARAAATAQGITLQRMVSVPQDGCVYNDTFIVN